MPTQLQSVLQALGNVSRTFITPGGPLAPSALAPTAASPATASPQTAQATPGVTSAPAVTTPAAPPSGFQLGNTIALLSALGVGAENIRRFLFMRQLQDPNFVAGQIRELAIPRERELLRAYAAPITANLAERGLGGARGVIAQALSQAVIPQAQTEAEQEYFASLGEGDFQNPFGMGLADIRNVIQQLYGGSGGTP